MLEVWVNINKGNQKRLVGKRPNESSGIRENLINPKLLNLSSVREYNVLNAKLDAILQQIRTLSSITEGLSKRVQNLEQKQPNA